ncbi:helix-turn-helix transcriptional regulator [Vagococcus hydrophili]|uniref:Helix-turn-helix transcriptional regulator n=1 Tax=Vagococcus hydrophili TaxID=2714947 RepID=A0A6G8ASM1_9ENTE|nr:helix-turn-helix transcriptional regulator [Vagococcus hydrophili]
MAQKLSVSRSTISNWETERNYPDIKMIVTISDTLDISLDQLLRGETEMLEAFAEDTQVRKKLSKKIKVLYCVLGVVLLVGVGGFYQTKKIQPITNSEQIKAIEMVDGKVQIDTNLPFYRSVTSYMMNPSFRDKDIIEIYLDSSIDWTFKNEKTVKIDVNEWEESKNVREFLVMGADGEPLSGANFSKK